VSSKAKRPLLTKCEVASDFDAPAQRQRTDPPVSDSNFLALRSRLMSSPAKLLLKREILEISSTIFLNSNFRRLFFFSLWGGQL
jgi:hypothetical protein